MENLPRVKKGDPITAEAWNQVVDAVNGSPNVSITRGKRRAKTQEPRVEVSAGASASDATATSKTLDVVALNPNQFCWDGFLVNKKTRLVEYVSDVSAFVFNGFLVITATKKTEAF